MVLHRNFINVTDTEFCDRVECCTIEQILKCSTVLLANFRPAQVLKNVLSTNLYLDAMKKGSQNAISFW